MAFNFTAGLGEIQQSGQVMGQGFAQLNQIQLMQAQQQQASQQQFQVAQMGYNQQLDRKAALHQQNDKMMAAFGDTAQTLSKIGVQQDTAKIKALEAQKDQFDLDKASAQYKQDQEVKEAAAAAIVDMNNKRFNPGPKLPGAAATEEGRFRKTPDGLTVLQQAAFIAKEDEMEAAEKKAKMEAESHAMNINHTKLADKLAVDSQAFNEEKWAFEEASKQAKSRIDAYTKTQEQFGVDGGVFASTDKETRTAQEASLKEAKALGSNMAQAKNVTDKLFAIAKVKPNSYPPNDGDWRAVGLAIKEAGGEDKAKAAALYGSLLFLGKQPGMGQLNTAEYGLMGQISGANALANLRALGEPGEILLNKLINVFESNMVREDNMVALGGKLNEQSTKNRDEILSKINSNYGYFGINKSQRAEMLTSVLSQEELAGLGQKLKGVNFMDLDYDKQIDAIFGEKTSEGLKLTATLNNDYLNKNRYLIMDKEKEAVNSWRPSVPGLKKAQEESVVNNFQNLITATTAKDRIPKDINISSNNSTPIQGGDYHIGVKYGKSVITTNGSGLPINIKNPLGQSRANQPPPGSIYDVIKRNNESTKNPVKVGSFH